MKKMTEILLASAPVALGVILGFVIKEQIVDKYIIKKA